MVSVLPCMLVAWQLIHSTNICWVHLEQWLKRKAKGKKNEGDEADNRVRLERWWSAPCPLKLLPYRALLEPLASGFPLVSSVIMVRPYSQGPGSVLSTFEFSKFLYITSLLQLCMCVLSDFSHSDSLRPHGLQPTRLLCPWDSPGKNPGVGCHFLLQCMKVKSESEVAQSCPTLRNPMDCSLPGSSVHGVFQARVLEWGAIAFSAYYNYYVSNEHTWNRGREELSNLLKWPS